VSGGIEAQTEQALKNMRAIVEAGGSELGKVVKTLVCFIQAINFRQSAYHLGVKIGMQVFIKNMDDFSSVNGVYEKFFGGHKPARSAVEVARLPKDVLVEIECIARYA
jgi:enamine deaminase RidA (YjgF/YER057c/UK114 family)